MPNRRKSKLVGPTAKKMYHSGMFTNTRKNCGRPRHKPLDCPEREHRYIKRANAVNYKESLGRRVTAKDRAGRKAAYNKWYSTCSPKRYVTRDAARLCQKKGAMAMWHKARAAKAKTAKGKTSGRRK